jgi:hypothetical protein
MDKKELLNESLKRHKQLLEYTFYVGEDDDPDFPGGKEDLLLGEQEPPEEGGEELPTDDVAVEEPVADAAPVEDIPADEPAMGEDPFGSEMPVEDEFAAEPDMEEPMDDMGTEGEVEVDVTDIVTKTEEAKEETSMVSSKVDDLLGKFGELESKLGGMDAIISKMDELEKEVIERNPNPTEKLNMRSLDSFPYTVKLTDFWDEKEGYDTGGDEVEQEYTLTQDEIDSDYSETEIKDSFRKQKDT